MFRHLLVPTDGTDISVENIGRAVEFARETGARITFFFANPDYSATSDGAVLHAASPELFKNRLSGDAQAILSKAGAAAMAAGVPHRSIGRVSDRPAEAILGTAAEEGCDLIFMASRGPKAIAGMMVGSETLKVLAGAVIPVLVSAVAKNAETPQLNAVIATIQDEHRSLLAVLQVLQHAAKEAYTGAPPDVRLLRAAVHYLRAFPERLHHPKEEQYLLVRLRARTHDFDSVIEEVERQHVDGAAMLTNLERALDRYEANSVNAFDELSRAVELFADAQREHMRLEEGIILPAARRHLGEEDWKEIAGAFAGNRDPLSDPDEYATFKELFATIMNLAR